MSHKQVESLYFENRIIGAKKEENSLFILENSINSTEKGTGEINIQNKTVIKPFIKWAGGKSALLKEIENYITFSRVNIKKYVEPFIGGGALFFNLISNYDFEKFYIGDNNRELINTYIIIKENVNALIEKLIMMQLEFFKLDNNERKIYYYKAREKFNSLNITKPTAVDKAALFIFLNKTCFNGLYRVNKKGKFNVPIGSYKNPTICDEINLRNVSKALKNVTIFCGDYSLSREFIDKNTFVYLDPPYRPISGTSYFTAYNAERFDEAEQIRLAKFVDEINLRGAKFVLSNSDPQNTDPQDKFFEKLYQNYEIHKVNAMRPINSKADGRGEIKELIISN